MAKITTPSKSLVNANRALVMALKSITGKKSNIPYGMAIRVSKQIKGAMATIQREKVNLN